MDIVFLGVFYPDVGDIYCLSTSLMHSIETVTVYWNAFMQLVLYVMFTNNPDQDTYMLQI